MFYEHLASDVHGVELKVNIDNLDPELQQLAPLLRFRIDNYSKVTTAKDRLPWRAVFKVVNDWFGTLNKVQQSRVVTTLATMHGEIIQYFGQEKKEDDYIGFMLKIGQHLVDLDEDIGMVDKMIAFAKENVFLGKPVAKEAHFTTKGTWRADDKAQLVAVILVIKMVVPIWGTWMVRMLADDVNTADKEAYCLPLLSKLISKRFDYVIDKLRFYILQNGMGRKTSDKVSSAFYGVTPDSKADDLLASLLIRSYVNVDLYQPKSRGIIVYTISILRSTQPARAGRSNQDPCFIREDITPDGEDSNASELENSRVVSDSPIDVVGITKMAVHETVRRTIAQYNLDQKVFEDAVEWYQEHPIPVTVVHKTLLGVYFGKAIGGAKAIDLLDHRRVAMLTAVLQMVLIEEDHAPLAPLISATVGMECKNPGNLEQLIALKYKNNHHYTNCSHAYLDTPLPNIGELFDAAILAVVEELTGTTLIYNMANSIWLANGTKKDNITNGKAIPMYEKVMEDFMKAVEHALSSTGLISDSFGI